MENGNKISFVDIPNPLILKVPTFWPSKEGDFLRGCWCPVLRRYVEVLYEKNGKIVLKPIKNNNNKDEMITYEIAKTLKFSTTRRVGESEIRRVLFFAAAGMFFFFLFS